MCCMSERWRELKCAREESRARSEGESIVAVAASGEERSGEGWPERERRISWSMLKAVVI